MTAATALLETLQAYPGLWWWIGASLAIGAGALLFSVAVAAFGHWVRP